MVWYYFRQAVCISGLTGQIYVYLYIFMYTTAVSGSYAQDHCSSFFIFTAARAVPRAARPITASADADAPVSPVVTP